MQGLSHLYWLFRCCGSRTNTEQLKMIVLETGFFPCLSHYASACCWNPTRNKFHSYSHSFGNAVQKKEGKNVTMKPHVSSSLSIRDNGPRGVLYSK